MLPYTFAIVALSILLFHNTDGSVLLVALKTQNR